MVPSMIFISSVPFIEV